jgi:hypothetical protein
MENKKQLTPFQQSCECMVLRALNANGLALSMRELVGERETCIRATVHDTDLEFRIDAHEARIFRSGRPTASFDRKKFYSPLRRESEFVRAVLEAAAENGSVPLSKALGKGGLYF